jgi:hypothetical protein
LAQKDMLPHRRRNAELRAEVIEDEPARKAS